MGSLAKLQPDCTPEQHQRFLALLPRILGEEGGLSDTPGDRGGVTNHGITLRFLRDAGRIDPRIIPVFDLDNSGDLDGQDVRDLTPELAGELYEHCLWVRAGYCTLPEPFDGMMLDQAVNCGVIGAGKILQHAVNRLSQSFIKEDGDLGPRTRAALTVCLQMHKLSDVVAAFRKAAMDHYRAICRADPEQLRFLDGWLNRAEALGNA